MAQQIITGHESEMAALEEQKNSPENRALVIKNCGLGLAEYGEVLRLAALGLLQPRNDNIFNEVETVDDQINTAELMIKRHLDILTKFA